MSYKKGKIAKNKKENQSKGARKMRKRIPLIVALCAVTVGINLSSCRKENGGNYQPTAGVYSYNTYTGVSPSNWNALTYRDNNDRQIMDYVSHGLFEYDLVRGENGEIDPNGYSVEYAMATSLSDVTSEYVGEKWGIAEGEKNKAWKITLRKDLKWEDGTPIKAKDFVYSMKEQLSPDFKNFRADSFYQGVLVIKGAKEYFEKKTTDFSTVGFFETDELSFVVLLAQPLGLLKEDGSLSYKAVYNFTSFPLVKEDLYESCKQKPITGSELWTSNYNSSKETTSSYGPYKLSYFQSGKLYVLEKNENWYGWGEERYKNQYQTDRISCETVAEYNTAWMKFQKGEIDGIGIDVSIANDYKGSEQAYLTPDDYVGSVQLQSSKEALKKRETAGVDKEILSYPEFRKALSLGLDRVAYNTACTTSSQAGFGLFNSMHYYDVENGKAYRQSDAAKRVLCETYGVNVDDYGSLDNAVNAVTGYDLPKARELIAKAYEKAKTAGEISDSDKVRLVYGTPVDNEITRRNFENLNTQWKTAMKGTPLENRFELTFDSSFGDRWATSFRSGAYDVCQAGWRGAAWDPGYFLLAYLDPSYAYSAAWDTKNHQMKFTVTGVKDGKATNQPSDYYSATMGLMDWYEKLNGDWSSGILNEEYRLPLIAALEREILTQYYTLPITNNYSASLMSYKLDYATYDYNRFLEYGGLRYANYHYDDLEWANYVKRQGGTLDYK
jgi:ABC-type transport system substrate-binding protein